MNCVQWTLGYLALRPPDQEFIFKFEDERLLTWDHLYSELGQALQVVRVQTDGNSFEFGAAQWHGHKGIHVGPRNTVNPQPLWSTFRGQLS